MSLVVCPKNGFAFLDFVENRVDGGAPDKRPRVRVVMGQVVVDGGHQLLDATKDAAAKTLLRQLAEPALDEVEPGGARRDDARGIRR